ncbi:MAG: NTE family protein RssA [Deltaproteobacteria bacterium ADurb.Bin151]|nr:MAG: NTE family protein RssA [Deltaproteobacteria bacterium ADurb.Bin151]HOQ42641.1 patatin-like phospholipase family protein [Smithellaceae bacterium]
MSRHVFKSHGSVTIVTFLFLGMVTGFILSATADVRAQTTVPEAPPRIGLVLSGGGARGLAHVGVIQVLEEMKIPISCIAGTSMGAIVGGLYAAGLSPAEMEKLVTSMEWNEAFKDKPPPSELTFRRKKDAAEYLIDSDLGFKNKKFQIPKGLLQGQNLNLMLKSILFHTEGVDDFDKLNIPFRAIATDIETGDAVVLGKGELVKAIRASMSIPALFAPVEIDNKMLVDGGVANNLPIDIVRQMGADVVIAVDISTKLSSRDQLTSSIEITAQLTSILVQRNTARQIQSLREGDILITPDMGDIGSADFFKAPEAVTVGRKKAEEMKPHLARFAAKEDDFMAYLKLQRHKDTEMPVIDSVEVVNKTSLPTKLIGAHIDIKPGKKLDLSQLRRNIDRIYGIDTFERVDFRLMKKDKSTGIVFEPLEKSWGPNYFRFGLGMEDSFKGVSKYALTTKFTKTAMNRLAGEWSTEVRIGENSRIVTEFYQPVDDSLSYFVAVNAGYRVRDFNDYNEDGDVTTQHRAHSIHAGLDVGRQFGNWGELRLGINREYGAVRVLVGDHTGPAEYYNRASIFASAAYSTLDNYVFPLSGTDAYLTWNYNLKMLGSDIEVQALAFKWMTALTWRKFTFLPSVEIRTTLDNDDMEVQDTFPLGGFLNLSGFGANELFGRHTGLARLIVYREIFSTGIGALTMPLYIGMSAETGNVWNKRADINFDSLILAGSVFIGTKTFLGPIYLAYGQAQRSHSSVYLYLGQRF